MQQPASCLSAAGLYRSRSLTGHSSRDVHKHTRPVLYALEQTLLLSCPVKVIQDYISASTLIETLAHVSLTLSVEALRAQVEIPP